MTVEVVGVVCELNPVMLGLLVDAVHENCVPATELVKMIFAVSPLYTKEATGVAEGKKSVPVTFIV